MAEKNGGANMLENKDYCDYDTCIALRELGCRIETEWYIHQPSYERGSSCYLCFGIPRETSVLDECDYIPRLSLYEAKKWLRENKDIHIEVYACAGGYIYELCKAYKPNSFSGGTTIYTPNDVDNPKLNDAGRYETFEDALLEGIKEAIKILKEKDGIS